MSRGCVTPAQIANLIEESEGDTDMVDGFDELPLEYQKKVEFALQHGHVPDEDWKGVSKVAVRYSAALSDSVCRMSNATDRA